MRYVDVNVFVYWLGDDAIFGDEATAIVKGIERGSEPQPQPSRLG